MDESVFQLGAWIGRGQAFGMIAVKCSAAQAQCLKNIRESRSFELLGLSWEDFCTAHAGITRSYADRLIRQLEEFGENYFRLSQLTQISPEAYRQIEAAVSDEGLEFEGETIPLDAAHAPRIRRAVAALRRQLRTAQARSVDGSLVTLQTRMEAWLEEMGRAAATTDPGSRAGLNGMIGYCRDKLAALERRLEPTRL